MDAPRFKLYHYPATRSVRVKWLLHELVGDDFDIEVIPLYEAAQYEPDYIEKNPNHGVPTLKITLAGGEYMYMIESAAIIVYLADAFPGKGLAPRAMDSSLRRADYLQVIHFAGSWMDMMLWQIRCHTHLLPESERDPRTVARYKSKFANEVEPQLRTRLDKAPYMCGENFSAADCIMGHCVRWARGYGL